MPASSRPDLLMAPEIDSAEYRRVDRAEYRDYVFSEYRLVHRRGAELTYPAVLSSVLSATPVLSSVSRTADNLARRSVILWAQ